MTKPNQDRPQEIMEPKQELASPIDATQSRTTALGGAGRARLWASLSAGVAILLMGGTVLLWQSKDNSTSGLSDPGPSERTVVVQPQAVSQQLDMTGTIAAGKSVAIVAPFDGVIREKRVQLGDAVQAGDSLVVMDTNDISGRYRDAQSAYLKAAMASDALKKWENGPDMLRAKRALEAAQGSLASLDRQVSELKGLLDQGIVSRNEYDGLIQQRDAQKNTVDSASDELAATEARGDGENRELVALDLENAQSRVNDLKQQMAGASVTSPIAGILTRPPVNASKQEPVSVEPGASVTRGTALFAIADTSRFTATGNVDEIDVNRIKIGQPVTVVSDAFSGLPIVGKIVNISAEADPSTNGGSTPKFQVRASFAVPVEALRSTIKLGMSARMTVETYANPAALLIPPEAVTKSGDQATVTAVDGGAEVENPVILGQTFPAGVEVVSGLKAGSMIKRSGQNRRDEKAHRPAVGGISSVSSTTIN